MARAGVSGARAAIAALLLCAQAVVVQTSGSTTGQGRSSHPEASGDERELRVLLAHYADGDSAAAVGRLRAHPLEWAPAVLDATLDRIEQDIRYHRREENRLGAGRDERLIDRLRADRLQILVLSAALQLQASRAVADVEGVGLHILGAERAIDRLHALREDFEEHGPVAWPVEVREPPAERDSGGPVLPSSRRGWPAVRAFVGRWYPAAVARLQELVELRLGPALIARGLARFPGHPDLLLADGSYVEARLALDRIDESLADRLYASDVRQRWRDDLRGAEDAYRRAMRAAGPSSEAAVRLARLRLQAGRAGEARALLDDALAMRQPAELRYLALLFRAAAAERDGALDRAADDYRAALALRPGAPTPMLALSLIADERNRAAEALEWAGRAATEGAVGADPWRRYIQGQAWQLEARIARLRNLEQD